MAKIYLKGGTEHTVIMDVREAFVRPFQATDWTDLRVGFFLSVTQAGADDTVTGLNQTITGPTTWTDHMAIGLTDRTTGLTFCGYTNLGVGRLVSVYDSMLVSSDIGIGTTNARYWRPKNSHTGAGDSDVATIIDSGIVRGNVGDGSQMHFVQDPATAGGYCTLFTLRFTRDNALDRARIITMQVKKTNAGHSSDILFTTTPTNDILEAQLEAFPATANTLGPIEMTQAPDTFYMYWPFSLSRLRCHGMGVLKVA